MRLRTKALSAYRTMKTALLLVLPLAITVACGVRRPARPGPAQPMAAQPAAIVPSAAAPESKAVSEQRAQEQLTLLIHVDGLGLFRDENLEAARMVADWARRRGLKVVDPDAAERVFAPARVAKEPTSGESCGCALSDFKAKTRYQNELGANGELVASVGCTEASCSLEIRTLDELGFFGKELLSLSSPYAAKLPWRQALARALSALPNGATDAEGTGGLGLLDGTGDGRVVAHPERLKWSLHSARDWEPIGDKTAQTNLTLAGKKETLRRCFGEGDGGAELLMEVDQRGKVARCESRVADDASSMCACQTFTAQGRADDALRGKRMFLEVYFSPADVVTPKRAVVEVLSRTHLVPYRDRHGKALWRPLVSDPSIDNWDPPSNYSIARCFATNQDGRERSVQMTVEFDAKGKVVRTQAANSKPHPLSQTERDCIERVFRSATTPCPAVSTSTAQVVVQVRFDTIGSKRP
jgi:hypothetical protein